MVGGGPQGGAASRKAETVTTESEDNTEQLAREECSRLSRQLRLMENDKRAYLEESNAAINHQKKSIAALEMENSKLEMELEIHKNEQNKEKEDANLAKVFKILDTYKKMDDQVKQQTKLSCEVEKRLNLTAGRVSKLKTKLEALEKADNIPLVQLDKKKFVLTKKLETVTGQFDAVVANNTELREDIDEILTQNIAVMEKCTQLEKQCDKLKSHIDDIVDQATTAYDQREEAVAKANALIDRNAKEKKLYTMEVSELGRIIRNEEKLLDFMDIKNKDRHFLETDEERLSRLEHAKDQILDETLESYRDNFGKLLTPETPTIQGLVEEFSELQHANIDNFTYINELNNEIEALQEETNKIREDIKRYSSETVERNQAKNAAIIKKQEELDVLRNDFRYVQVEMGEYKSLMDEIVRLIERLFLITDCSGNSAPVLELLGGTHQEISPKNVALYVNVLEHRIADIFGIKFQEKQAGTPSLRSPRPASKACSDISGVNRPRIILSVLESEDRINSDDELTQSIVDTEPSPLAYSAMRDKVLDAVGRRSASSISGDESLASNVIITK